ncbi:unnamed protein product [Polarella glacialis]|uniref:Uncharacterized protein n=1 Tax=Polarella glacialis TaxID=89957 RepID=A0A813HEZ9_POLGL|nr:unnamed protein product [Polarella glacialis]
MPRPTLSGRAVGTEVGFDSRKVVPLGVFAVLLVGSVVAFSCLGVPTPTHPRSLQARGDYEDGFVTNAQKVLTFSWTGQTRSASAAFQAVFTNGHGYWNPVFSESGLKGVVWTGQKVVDWVENDLLAGRDPFLRHGGLVPVPWDTLPANGAVAGDQLLHEQYVGYSRRQVCFIVAKSMLGANTLGYENGLGRLMFKKEADTDCIPSAGDFGKSWWGLLAACAADPNLVDGSQGPLVLVTKGAKPGDLQAQEEHLRDTSSKLPLAYAGFRLCRYDDGGSKEYLSGIPEVPKEGCRPPSAGGPGVDFMTGGLPGQALQDTTTTDMVGGHAYGKSCYIGGGQDERLMLYMPELSALAFFLSQARPDASAIPSLRTPVWVLGARVLFSGLDGTARFSHLFQINRNVPMLTDLTDMELNSINFMISTSRPVLAIKSPMVGLLKSSFAAHSLQKARLNKEKLQRSRDVRWHGLRVVSQYSFGSQVMAWYHAVKLDSYAADLHPVLRKVVKSIGAGPWVAGLSWGDSQLGVLAMWLGHALAAQSWGASGELPLDYYLYSAFTENPGNQCLLHSAPNCHKCLRQCVANPLPSSAFWLPQHAWMKSGNPCVSDGEGACSNKGLEDVMWIYGLKHAGELWDKVDELLGLSSDSSRSVFDMLMDDYVSSA